MNLYVSLSKDQILEQALSSIFLSRAQVKFIVFFALFLVVQELVKEMASWLPSSTDLLSLFSALPDGVWYFLNLFLVPQGLGMVLSAMLTRFIIRRIPVIG